jgi:hypothetical protein
VPANEPPRNGGSGNQQQDQGDDARGSHVGNHPFDRPATLYFAVKSGTRGLLPGKASIVHVRNGFAVVSWVCRTDGCTEAFR